MTATDHREDTRDIVPALRTTVTLATIDRVPHQRAMQIACQQCGYAVPRWTPRHDGQPGRLSGLRLLAAHQLQVHGEQPL